MTKGENGNNARIRDLLQSPTFSLTPSEQKLVQVLLADYPMSGLSTQAALAKRAGVSDPTVVRFVTKMGFESFGAFQSKLLEEVEARLRSPLMMVETKRADNKEGTVVKRYLSSACLALKDVEETAVFLPYERAVDLIINAKRVVLVGGRFSRHVAGMLGGYLSQFRSSVMELGPISKESFDILIDLSKKDVVIAFDYRRYQTDVIDFVSQAAARGAHVILFTDPWLSPISEYAEILITGRVEVDSPYDTLVSSVAQMEALVAQVVAAESTSMHRRAGELELVRDANQVTVSTVTLD